MLLAIVINLTLISMVYLISNKIKDYLLYLLL